MAADLHSAGRRHQRGFTLLWAIFLLVVLASMGAYLVQVSAVEHGLAAQTVQAVRAYRAAHGGIEWARYRIVRDRDCRGINDVGQWAYAAPGLNDLQVRLRCSEHRSGTDHGGGAVFELHARASYGSYGQPGYVRRELSATVRLRAVDAERDTLVYLREIY